MWDEEQVWQNEYTHNHFMYEIKSNLQKLQKLQKSIIDYLRLNGWYVWKNNSVGTYNKKTGGYIPAQTKGVSDLTAIKNGIVVFIEVKLPNGKQSEHQKEFEKQIINHQYLNQVLLKLLEN